MPPISERNRFLEEARMPRNRAWSFSATAGEVTARKHGWEIWLANIQPVIDLQVTKSVPPEQQSAVLKTIWSEFMGIYRDTGNSSELKPTNLVKDIARVAVANPDKPDFKGVVKKYVAPILKEEAERRKQLKEIEIMNRATNAAKRKALQ